MIVGLLTRKAALSVLLFAALAGALLTAKPPGLPVLDLDADLRAKSVPVFLELQKSHYGATAAGFSEVRCDDGFTQGTGTTRYDGWHFVIPNSNGSDAFTELQVVFTDAQGRLFTYRISDDGTSVTTNPGPGGFIYFRGDAKHVEVLTPNPGSLRILDSGSAALQTASPPAPYRLAIYAKAQGGTDTGSAGVFNLSHTCSNGPITPPGGVPCQYATDASVLTASGGSRTITGTLTCRGNALPGQTVTAVSGASRQTTTTGTGGAFTFTGLPAGTYEVSFPGSADVPAASPVEVTVSQ